MQHRLERIVGEAFKLLGETVLDGMGHPHDGRLEAERVGLVGGRVPECGGGDQQAGNVPVVQRLDVMQTA
ncbi:MAG: hypothetical protein OXE96_10865 [Gemmatimonadetes bacterium]|nr:hypothetical protein [Gemmatimonadota bacterium]